MMKKHAFRRTMCLCMAMLMFLAALVACGKKEKTLLSLEGEMSLSVNQYELLLSRMKGTLEYSGYPTDESAFWDQIITSDGDTYDDYFRNSVLNEAKRMLARLYLYEKEYGLSLSDAAREDAEEQFNDILTYHFDDSISNFNRALSAYGINADMLLENYLMQEKMDHLISHVTALTGDAAREDYYAENYVCFRQILFPLYEYLYETDENEDVIYYQEGSTRICYDKENGVTRTGTDGKVVVDENGDTVYFTADGRICYDTVRGVVAGLDEDKDGYTDLRELDEDEIKTVTDRVAALEQLIQTGDFTTFEEYGDNWSQDDVWNNYPNGIFINLNKTYEVNYIDDIQKAMAEMAVGDTAVIPSENAYHFIMKYEAEDGAWQQKDNADWFASFDQELAENILDAKCEALIKRIEVNEEAFATAATMKDIGSNMQY